MKGQRKSISLAEIGNWCPVNTNLDLLHSTVMAFIA
jgi:hypothetical protein